MIARRLSHSLPHNRSPSFNNPRPPRKVQVTLVGSVNEIGSNVALCLANNRKIEKLKLYDDDKRINGLAMELQAIPNGPKIECFYGDNELPLSIRNAEIIVMISSLIRFQSPSQEAVLAANALKLHKLCRAISENNTFAFLAISISPINSMLPFASAVLAKNRCYNPYKVFGITQIDSTRCQSHLSHVASMLGVEPISLKVPVIGGHSAQTIVPLFSNITPQHHIEYAQAEMMTRLVRMAEKKVINEKNGQGTANLAVAWSVSEFIDGLVDAILGQEVILNCYTANANHGTRFFAGPTIIGSKGLILPFTFATLSPLEKDLLNKAVPFINRDVFEGETYVSTIECIGRNYA